MGELRLVPPRPPQPWTEPLDLTADSEVMCPQLSETVAGDLLGREDCLTINIYAPTSEPGTALLPVLVYIYGGGFITGSARAEEYGPDRWLDEDILVVTVNYRFWGRGKASNEGSGRFHNHREGPYDGLFLDKNLLVLSNV